MGNPTRAKRMKILNPPTADWVRNAQRYIAELAKSDFALPAGREFVEKTSAEHPLTRRHSAGLALSTDMARG